MQKYALVYRSSIRCPKQCIAIVNIKTSLDSRCLSVCQFANIIEKFPLRSDTFYYKNKCLQYNTTSNRNCQRLDVNGNVSTTLRNVISHKVPMSLFVLLTLCYLKSQR